MQAIARELACPVSRVRTALIPKYSITKEEIQVLAERQHHQCAICKRTGKLCVDHCHTTAKVRGLLCDRCNTSLGLLGDSIERLLSAVRYLESASDGALADLQRHGDLPDASPLRPERPTLPG